MKGIAVSQSKLVEKYKKQVHKQYPGAYLAKVGMHFTILQEQEDLQVKDVLSEFYFPPQKDSIKAWELASLTSKTTQNLNRTHPLRSEGAKLENQALKNEMRLATKEAAKIKKRNRIDIY